MKTNIDIRAHQCAAFKLLCLGVNSGSVDQSPLQHVDMWWGSKPARSQGPQGERDKLVCVLIDYMCRGNNKRRTMQHSIQTNVLVDKEFHMSRKQR